MTDSQVSLEISATLTENSDGKTGFVKQVAEQRGLSVRSNVIELLFSLAGNRASEQRERALSTN